MIYFYKTSPFYVPFKFFLFFVFFPESFVHSSCHLYYPQCDTLAQSTVHGIDRPSTACPNQTFLYQNPTYCTNHQRLNYACIFLHVVQCTTGSEGLHFATFGSIGSFGSHTIRCQFARLAYIFCGWKINLWEEPSCFVANTTCIAEGFLPGRSSSPLGRFGSAAVHTSPGHVTGNVRFVGQLLHCCCRSCCCADFCCCGCPWCNGMVACTVFFSRIRRFSSCPLVPGLQVGCRCRSCECLFFSLAVACTMYRRFHSIHSITAAPCMLVGFAMYHLVLV